MFSLQNWKTKLIYIGFGSFFGCLCTIIGMLASPVTAQRDKFGHIECTGITVVDADGVSRVILSTNMVDATSFILDDKSGVFIGIGDHGGTVDVFSKNGESAAHLHITEYGGRVDARGKDGKHVVLGNGRVEVYYKDRNSRASLSITEYGGIVNAWGKDGGLALLTVNEHGGRVAVSGKDYGGVLKGLVSMAALSIDELGGRVQVNGKGEGAAAIGINEYGNGAVSTWDKNGYLQK